MAFLLHAKNITTEEVLGLLGIPLLPDGRTYQYVAGDNTQTKWEPYKARINQRDATASYEHGVVAARRGMAERMIAGAYKMKRRLQQYQQHPCALLLTPVAWQHYRSQIYSEFKAKHKLR